ncbi:MAG: tetratricopeptide repeat protein [Desulfobacteraceae bacterium]|nr:tetratricopeptide repeat protein [Desulfobacteraceae bacterium]MDH3573086.1 tetratricopeptide repeat protein [Desulfobacteraceae bacterium]MDH3836559.1 tetratricopeptide repeat protein [Desulfobacteraceae bacterium]MDH3874124.1 tetratricopeptide repeat protein [Desulfobacteraceae bacterium]
MKGYFIRSISVLFLSLYFLLHFNNVAASPHPSNKKSYKGTISRIVSITTHKSKGQTIVSVLGDGKISEYIAKPLKAPPRIVVDIFCAARLLKGTSKVVENSDIKIIRTGYHTQKIRIVFDVKGSVVPSFTDKPVDNELIITLKSKEGEDKKEYDNTPSVIEETMDVPSVIVKTKDLTTFKKNESVKVSDISKDIENPHKKKALEEVTPLISETPGNQKVGAPEKETEHVFKKQNRSKEDGLTKTSPEEKLTQMVEDDGKEDTSVYLKCLDTYKAKDWEGAIENLTRLIKTYPDGRYTEKAYFILAKSYNHLNTDFVSVQNKEIKSHYEDAISRFPTSEYVPDALFSIGNLYFYLKNYYEALGYYNLVLKKDKGSILRVKALMQKVKVLLLKHRREDALSALDELETLTSEYPNLYERKEAKKEKAKILYEMNKFNRSLKILNELNKEDPETIYKHPEISLYIGYNYYQLGDNQKARESLYRYYNTCPEREINHLVLNQIGDTYRNEGMIEDAVKFYRMVLERYPDTDGAIISKIRLAEQQEDKDWIEKTRKEMGSPKKIYENIVNDSVEKKDEKNPLMQLSMLKLGITYQKEKEYGKSLKVLKELLEKYPRTSLKKELLHALMVTIEGMLKKEMKNHNYINIINLYLKDEKIFSMVNAPELFLPVARAFVYINLDDMAIEVFKKADILFADNDKPADLLFSMGKYLFEQDNIEGAFKRFDILIANHPYSKFASEAYQLQGSILLKQKQYKLAADTFIKALKYPIPKCQRAWLLIDKAKALTGSNAKESALMAMNEVNEIKKDCDLTDFNIDQELGDLYLSLGDVRKALNIFNQVIQTTTESSNKNSLKLKLAECYWRLDKKEDSLALYNQIMSLNDPFWSNLAKERMDEIQFDKDNMTERLN